jgi:hypothetical protein
MQGANVVPTDFQFGCILKYWECFGPDNLKKRNVSPITIMKFGPDINWGIKGGVKMGVLIMTPSYS